MVVNIYTQCENNLIYVTFLHFFSLFFLSPFSNIQKCSQGRLGFVNNILWMTAIPYGINLHSTVHLYMDTNYMYICSVSSHAGNLQTKVIYYISMKNINKQSCFISLDLSYNAMNS